MTRRMLTALASTLSLTLAIAAQESKPYTNPNAPPPGALVPVVPAPPVLAPQGYPNIQHRVIPPPPTINFPAGRITPSQTREHYAVQARIELNDGMTLTGEIHSDSPLPCVALFGPAAIPFNQIKGIEWQRRTDQPDETENKATLVLLNGDSLTVSVTIPAIQVKTTWGHATVDLSQVRSILMTIEKVKWVDAPDGRRLLVPDTETPPTNPN
jgi:hypothetical protein